MLLQLKQSILDKQKIELKVKDLDIETSKLQREISILSQEFDEEINELNKLEKNKLLSIFPNYENKLIDQQEKVRKLKRKLNNTKYNYELSKLEFNRQKNILNEMIENEIKYEQELENILIQNKEYEQLKKENEHYLFTIEQGNKIIECLKKIDLYFTYGDNYQTIDKRYTLGNTTWIMSNPRVDIRNLEKEIHIFEDPLSQINTIELKEDIQLYFKYSKDFFEHVLELAGLELKRNSYFPIKVIDFKRDVSNILNKIRIVYDENMIKQKEIRKQFEESI